MKEKEIRIKSTDEIVLNAMELQQTKKNVACLQN